MSFNQKNKKQTQKGFILYTSLKNALESSGIDSMTAGQTAWLNRNMPPGCHADQRRRTVLSDREESPV